MAARPIHSYLPEGLLSEAQMKRLERKTRKMAKQETRNTQLPSNVTSINEHKKEPIRPKTQKQRELIESLKHKEQTLIFGPAGTGKTFVTVGFAADMYMEGRVKKIILTRPNKGVGSTIGFLPGSLEEKFAVWLAESISILKQRMGEAVYEIALKKGAIELVPLEYIRGRSFDDAFILATEMQNSSPDEMLALVTRVGQNTKLVLEGDVRQSDVKGNNGMSWAKSMIENNKPLQQYSGIVEFTIDDVVRSGLVGAWVRAVWSE